jgi:glutathione S-transferase
MVRIQGSTLATATEETIKANTSRKDHGIMSLILYGAPLSPFVRKVDVLLREKEIEFDIESVNIMPMPDWFVEISPARRIPVLRDTEIGEEGRAGTIPDSSAICGFIERRNPEPALYPGDPFDYGRALWFEEWADTELAGTIGMGIFRPVMFPRFQGKEPDVATAKETWSKKLPRYLDYLESELEGREFLVGDSLSIGDISVACQLANLELVAGLPDKVRWPGIVDFAERMTSRPSFTPNLTVCRKIVKEKVDLDA